VPQTKSCGLGKWGARGAVERQGECVDRLLTKCKLVATKEQKKEGAAGIEPSTLAKKY
jgi:hypothetical protein